MILVAIILLAQPIVASLILDRIYGSSYRREMRSKRSFVSLAALLAVEEEISHNKDLCKDDGTGIVFLSFPQGLVKVFSHDDGRFGITIVARVIDDAYVDEAREYCKELDEMDKRIRYSVGYEPYFERTCFSITCDFEEDPEDEDSEYYILDYVRSYLVPKQRELSVLWKRKMQEFS